VPRESEKKVLVSHSTKDAEIANALSELILKCSLRQIVPWYSSDSTGQGGIGAGERWFEKIRGELRSSKSVIVVVTPNSVGSSWVHFEAGFGAATGELEIIPVVYGLGDFSQVPDPLPHWQMFRIGHAEDCILFLEKIFGSMDVHFDRDLVADPASKFIKALEEKVKFDEKDTELADTNDEFKKLRNYLDKKFFDLASRSSKDETNFSGYEFEIENRVGSRDIRVHIDLQTSFADVLNDVYFRLEDEIGVYTYLEEWVLKDGETGQKFILREIASEIPARLILPPERWVVAERLDKPYSGTDSDDVAEFHGGFLTGVVTSKAELRGK